MNEFTVYTSRFIPWEAGAEGPDAYDCLAFFRDIQGRHFGVPVPRIMVPDYDDGRELVALLNGHGEREHWIKVAKPQHGDGVLVRSPMHIGTYLDLDGGGVLHCVRGACVTFTSLASWQFSGFGRCDFFRHESKL